MKISIIHPSRGRAEMALTTKGNWLRKAELPGNIEYILSCDNDDPCYTQYHYYYNCLWNDNKSAIEAINNAAKVCTGDLIIVVSDDFDCPNYWDTLLLNNIDSRSDFLVKTLDGIQKTLITLPIMDRVYYNRFGYVYHPDYLHMESDVEMTAVGMMLGRVINVPLLFEHRHYSTGKSKKDMISVKNDSTYKQGKEVITRRLLDNFGIQNPLIQFKDIKWH